MFDKLVRANIVEHTFSTRDVRPKVVEWRPQRGSSGMPPWRRWHEHRVDDMVLIDAYGIQVYDGVVGEVLIVDVLYFFISGSGQQGERCLHESKSALALDGDGP